MYIKDQIERRIDEFHILCQKHKVKKLFLFGSALTGKFNIQTSDLDFLVEIDSFDPIERGENLIALWANLEDFFQRKIDLLTHSSISNPYLRKSIDATKQLIYDGSRQKVLV
jgi:predicted nucleotidyltransferase